MMMINSLTLNRWFKEGRGPNFQSSQKMPTSTFVSSANGGRFIQKTTRNTSWMKQKQNKKIHNEQDIIYIAQSCSLKWQSAILVTAIVLDEQYTESKTSIDSKKITQWRRGREPNYTANIRHYYFQINTYMTQADCTYKWKLTAMYTTYI